MGNIENNDDNDTIEIVEEVTPSVSTGNDGIENSENAGEEISEQATAEIVKAEATEEVAPTVSSAEVEITSEPVKIEEEFILSKEIIKELIQKSNANDFETLWIPLIMENQTIEEVSKTRTVEKNGLGLNSEDGKTVSFYSGKIKKGEHLTSENIKHLKKILPKYHKQYIEKAQENVELAQKMHNVGKKEEKPKTTDKTIPTVPSTTISITIPEKKSADGEVLNYVLDSRYPTASIEKLNNNINADFGINVKLTKEHALDDKILYDYLSEECLHLSEDEKFDITALVTSCKNLFIEAEWEKFKIPEEWKLSFKNGIEQVVIKYRNNPAYGEPGEPEKLESRTIVQRCLVPAFINTRYRNFHNDVEEKELVKLGLVIYDSKGFSREIDVNLNDICTSKGLCGLINRNLLTDDTKTKYLGDYFSRFYYFNQFNLNDNVYASRNGWNAELNKIILGNRVYSKDGSEDILVDTKGKDDYFKHITKTGDIHACQRLSRHAFDHRLARLLFYAVFAAPALRICGGHNVIIDLCGDTSQGKTLYLRLALSLIGFAPEKGGLLHSGDTSISRAESTAYAFNDLIKAYDELRLKKRTEEIIDDLIYIWSNGNGNERSNKDGTDRLVRTFFGVFIITGEMKLMNINSNDGAKARVIFVNITKRDDKDKSEKMRELEKKKNIDFNSTSYIHIPRYNSVDLSNINSAINENYGHFTETYMEILFENKDKLKSMYEKFKIDLSKIKEIENQVQQRQSEYFASLMVGGYLFEETVKRINEKYGTTFKSMNYEKIIKKYFKICVIEDKVELADVLTASQFSEYVSQHTATNEIESDIMKDAKTRIGWMTSEYIYVFKNAIDEFFKNKGRTDGVDTILDRWVKRDIIKVFKAKGKQRICGQHNFRFNGETISFGNIVGIKKDKLSILIEPPVEDDETEKVKNENISLKSKNPTKPQILFGSAVRVDGYE